MRSLPLRLRQRLAFLAAAPLVLVGLPFAQGAGAEPGNTPVDPLDGGGAAELVSVLVSGQDDVLDLIAAGADVTEYAKPVDGGLEVHVVATEQQQDDLRAKGFAVGEEIVGADDVESVVGEREAAL